MAEQTNEDKVVVMTGEDQQVVFNAESWNVIKNGTLHVIERMNAPGIVIANFPPGRWLGVYSFAAVHR